MFVKSRLLTPGPTLVAESTRLAMAAAHPHHRSPEYSRVHKRALELLRRLWDTDSDVLAVTGSGTASMESALRTVLRPGDRIAVVTGGKFAERWRDICGSIACEVVEIHVEWGACATAADVAGALEGGPPVAAMVCVASETSTGALHPVAELGRSLRAHSPDAALIVDGITAVGTVDLSMRRDRIDVLVSGSQKAFGLPPGLGMVGVSEAAWELAARPGCDSWYMDLRRERKQTETGQTAFTPAISLVVGLLEVMERWDALGRDEIFQHCASIAEATRAAVKAMGLTLFARDTPSPALTSVLLPEGISSASLRNWTRSHCGVTISGGQDQWKDRIVRIGHLGVVDALDALAGIAAFEMALRQAGVAVPVGAGLKAALEVLEPALSTSASAAWNP